jgi:hypothetical protein
VSCVVGAVILLILILTAGRQLEPSKAWKHSLTTAAAILAAVGSALQAVKARQKATHHEAESRKPTVSGELKAIHLFDAQHFHSVGTMWYVVAAGAAATIAGEIIDFFTDK